MKSGIKPLVKIMNGPFISDEQNFLKNISPYIRRARTVYSDSVHLTMNVIGCKECGEDVATTSTEVGSVATTVNSSIPATQSFWPHETEGHKCYPIGGASKPSLPPSDKEDDSYKRLLENVSTYQAGTINLLRTTGNKLIFMKLFSTMADEKYVEYENVLGLANLFVFIADYTATFAGSVCMIEMVYTTNLNNKKPIAVVKISSYVDIKKQSPKVWRAWEDCLRGTNISLAMSLMGPNEQAPLQSMDDITVNWCFVISRDVVSNTDTFVLSDCRPIVAKNTYGLTILNKDFTLNVASNLEMRVPNGATFRFVASIDSAVLDTISIKVMEPTGWKSYTVTPRDISTLKECGIVIENTDFSIEKTTYVISVTRTRDIQISLNSMMLTFDPLFIPSWDAKSGNVTVIDVMEAPTFNTGLRTTCINRDRTLTMSFDLNFGFIQVEGTNVSAYVVPMSKYADKIDEDSCQVNIKEYLPMRTNAGVRILMNVSNIPLSAIDNGTFLLRVVFGNGSLSAIAESTDARTVKVGNYETAFQFEIKFNNDKESVNCAHDISVVSTFGGYTFGTNGTVAWNPPMPMPLYTQGIGVISSEYYQMATINPLNRKGSLTLKPNIKLENVPLGIPAGAGAQILNIPANPIDENYYFTFIKVPYTAKKSSVHVSVPEIAMKGVHSITVKSGVRQLFDLKSESCYYDELNGVATYYHPTLTCDDKYVLLPVFFSNKDTLIITIEDSYCSGKIEFIVDVDLGELPDVDNEGEGDNGEETPPVVPSNPDEGNTETPPTDGEDNKDETFGNIMRDIDF